MSASLPTWGSPGSAVPCGQPRGTRTQAAEQVAALAASPTCCPVPSHNELVRPCYCHREQMSQGSAAPAALSRSLRGAAGAAFGVSCSGGLACVSSGPNFSLLLPPPFFSCSVTPAYCTPQDFWVLLAVFCPVCCFALARCAVISPRRCRSARCPVGPQNPVQCSGHSLLTPQQGPTPSHFHS